MLRHERLEEELNKPNFIKPSIRHVSEMVEDEQAADDIVEECKVIEILTEIVCQTVIVSKTNR